MAALAVLGQQSITVGDSHFVFSKIRYNTSGDTVTIPHGAVNATVLYGRGEGTAPSVTLAQGQNGDTATLGGGNTGVEAWLISRHSGNIAALGAGSVSS